MRLSLGKRNIPEKKKPMRRRMTSFLSCANVTETASRVLSLASSSSSSSCSSSSRANSLVALFARRRRRGRILTTTSASFAPGGDERKRFARCCSSSSSSFASQSLSTGLASKSRISDNAIVRNKTPFLLLKDARRRRDGFQSSSRNLKTLSGRAASSGGDFGRLGVRARDSFSFVSLSLSLFLFARFATTSINNTSDGIYCVIFSTRERLWNEFKAEVTDRCVSLST